MNDFLKKLAVWFWGLIRGSLYSAASTATSSGGVSLLKDACPALEIPEIPLKVWFIIFGFHAISAAMAYMATYKLPKLPFGSEEEFKES